MQLSILPHVPLSSWITTRDVYMVPYPRGLHDPQHQGEDCALSFDGQTPDRKLSHNLPSFYRP